MIGSFDRYFPLLLDHEGRTLDRDRRDPGNWTGGRVGVGDLIGTKYGIDAASHAHEVDIPNLTVAQAEAIYRAQYAPPIRFDDLPAGVDVVVLDGAINSGAYQSTLWLQRAVGADADGRIGPKTLAAVEAVAPIAIIGSICTQRLAFLKKLRIWPTYGAGWTTRVKDLKTFATSLAQEHSNG